MEVTRYTLSFFIVWSLCLFSSCSDSGQNSGAKPQIAKQISEVSIDLPQGEGYNTFVANCTSCHSARYVQMQPNFNHKTWEKTVDKMIHKYGAPISDTTVGPIVDYLMAVRGK